MKDVSFLTKNLIVHRGLHNDEIPENSMRAFKKAKREGYIIELDIHLIKDGNIVVFHDDNLKRMTGVDKKIIDCTYEELKQLKLLNSNETIPKLVDVLKEINGKVPIIIELKYDQRVGKLEKEVVKVLDKYNGEFCVKSFNPLSIIWFRINRCDYIRGCLLGNKNDTVKKKIISSYIMIKLCKPDFLSCNYKLYNNKKIRKFKIPVIAWTIRTKNNYEKYKNKFDNIIFEYLK